MGALGRTPPTRGTSLKAVAIGRHTADVLQIGFLGLELRKNAALAKALKPTNPDPRMKRRELWPKGLESLRLHPYMFRHVGGNAQQYGQLITIVHTATAKYRLFDAFFSGCVPFHALLCSFGNVGARCLLQYGCRYEKIAWCLKGL